MARYNHPVFERGGDNVAFHTGVVNLETGGFDLQQGSTLGYSEVTTDIDAFLARVHKSHDLREQLGIPAMTYHAYGFSRVGYNITHVRNIVEWARGHDLEVRIWVVEESAKLLVVVVDPDLSEDSGWRLYQYVSKHAGSRESYGFSSWYEFCAFGTPVPDHWELIERGDVLCAASPDGEQFVTFG